jgi:hypothetical protein
MSNSRDLLRPFRILYATDEHGDKTVRGRWRFRRGGAAESDHRNLQ